jgi:hypothetical protein
MKKKKREKGKSSWFLITDFFDDQQKETIDMKGVQIVVEGDMVDNVGSPSVVVVSVPPDAFSNHMAQDLLDYFHSQFGKKVIVLSHNIQLAKLKQIPASVAEAIMKREEQRHVKGIPDDAPKIHIHTTVADEKTEGSEQRQDLRAEDGPGAAEDLRPAEPA